MTNQIKITEEMIERAVKRAIKRVKCVGDAISYSSDLSKQLLEDQEGRPLIEVMLEHDNKLSDQLNYLRRAVFNGEDIYIGDVLCGLVTRLALDEIEYQITPCNECGKNPKTKYKSTKGLVCGECLSVFDHDLSLGL